MSEFVHFIPDAERVYRYIADEGLLPANKAKARADLYAARCYLTPNVKQIIPAIQRLVQAVSHNPAELPHSLFIFGKGIFRLVFGERVWSRIIDAKVRLSS